MTVFVVPPNNIYDGIQLRDGDELLVKEGGVIVDTTILLGGSEEIFAGKSEGTEIAGGEEELLGGESVNPNEFPVADSTTITMGVLAVEGGLATNTRIIHGTLELNFPDSTSDHTTIVGGVAPGAEIVSSGIAKFTLIDGGELDVKSTSGLPPGIANNTTISNTGAENVSGGISNATTIQSGGIENVSDGGTSNNTAIQSGGVENVSNGGVSNATTIFGLGLEQVYKGGTANNAIIAGGLEVVSGTTHDTVVSGGTLNVLGGGIADGNTNISGGVVGVELGGSIHGVNFGLGATFPSILELATPSELIGTIGFFSVGDVIDFLNTIVTGVNETGNTLTVTYGEDQTASFSLADQQANTEFKLQSDGRGGTDLILQPLPGSPVFSASTVGTTVYAAEYGVAPSATELNTLTVFTTAQYAYGQQIGVQDPTVYAYQSLGAALASTAPLFQNTFAPSNSAYPASAAGDAQFVVDAYPSVFGSAASQAQIELFTAQLNVFEDLYTAAGVFGNSSNIDLLARGAVYGQMLGMEQEIPPPTLVGLTWFVPDWMNPVTIDTNGDTWFINDSNDRIVNIQNKQASVINIGQGSGDTVNLDGFFNAITLGNGAGDKVIISETSFTGKGSNVINLGNGNNDTVQSTNSSNDTINIGTGNNDTVNGKYVNVGIKIGDGASDTVTVGPDSGFDAITLGLGGGDKVNAVGLNDSAITIGDGNGDEVSSIAVQGGQSSSNHITLGNGAGDTVTINTTDHDTIVLGNGDGDAVSASINLVDKITLGNGNGDAVHLSSAASDTVILGNGAADRVDDDFGEGDNNITLGDGNNDSVTLFRTGGEVITLGSGVHDTVDAINSNNAIIKLGDGNSDQVFGGRNSNITVGNGADTIHVGFANTVTVGAGHTGTDTFKFDQQTAGGIGAVTINHFDPGKDVIVLPIWLDGVSPQDVNGNAVMTLDNKGDVVTLVGVHASDLNTHNVQFA